MARDLLHQFLPEKNSHLELDDYHEGQKNILTGLLRNTKVRSLRNIRYEQLLPYAYPEDGDPFRVVIGDFVTTGDGTGIVHIAPSFGADDFRVGNSTAGLPDPGG